MTSKNETIIPDHEFNVYGKRCENIIAKDIIDQLQNYLKVTSDNTKNIPVPSQPLYSKYDAEIANYQNTLMDSGIGTFEEFVARNEHRDESPFSNESSQYLSTHHFSPNNLAHLSDHVPEFNEHLPKLDRKGTVAYQRRDTVVSPRSLTSSPDSSTKSPLDGFGVDTSLLFSPTAQPKPWHKAMKPSTSLESKLYYKDVPDFKFALCLQDLSQSLRIYYNPTFNEKISSVQSSPTGEYIAASYETIIAVWMLAPSVQSFVKEDESIQRMLLLYSEKPVRIYKTESSPVTFLAWSRSHYLITLHANSQRISVWHVSKNEIIYAFEEENPSSDEPRKDEPYIMATFHPKDDHVFSTISNSQFKLWNITDRKCYFSRNIPIFTMKENFTHIAFNSRGTFLLGTTSHGKVYFFDYEKLRYDSHFVVAHKEGGNGLPIYSIICIPPTQHYRKERFMVTCQDHSIRTFDNINKLQHAYFYTASFLNSPNPQLKFPWKAHLSEDGEFVLAPSANRNVLVLWRYYLPLAPEKPAKKKLGIFKSFFKKKENLLPDTMSVASMATATSPAPTRDADYASSNIPYSYEYHYEVPKKMQFLDAFFLPDRFNLLLYDCVKESPELSRYLIEGLSSFREDIENKIFVSIDVEGHIKVWVNLTWLSTDYFASL